MSFGHSRRQPSPGRPGAAWCSLVQLARPRRRKALLAPSALKRRAGRLPAPERNLSLGDQVKKVRQMLDSVSQQLEEARRTSSLAALAASQVFLRTGHSEAITGLPWEREPKLKKEARAGVLKRRPRDIAAGVQMLFETFVDAHVLTPC